MGSILNEDSEMLLQFHALKPTPHDFIEPSKRKINDSKASNMKILCRDWKCIIFLLVSSGRPAWSSRLCSLSNWGFCLEVFDCLGITIFTCILVNFETNFCQVVVVISSLLCSGRIFCFRVFTTKLWDSCMWSCFPE